MTRIRCAFFLIITLALTSVAAQVAAAQDTDFFVYIGTYTGFKYVHHSKTYGRGESRSKGIYVSRFNAATGELSPAQLAGEIINPSFLTISPNHRFLYAVSEDPLSVGPPLDHASYVSAFAIDSATGKLRLLNTVPSGGTSTCFISMDKTGKYVLMANFGSGSVSVVQVKEDGSLGNLVSFIQNVGHSVNPAIQMEPHPHSILVSPDNRYAIVSDLGTDKVLIFRFDAATGMLSPPDPPSASVYPGGGPRHFTFDPAGKFGYQLSEMSGVVDVFAWDASKGSLTGIQRAQTMPHDFLGINHSAEIEIHPSGKFLYESNRRTMSETEGAPDTIGVFSIDAKGILAPVEQSLTGGVMPRSFALDPTGKYLLAANQVSNNVVVYAIDGATGRLTNTGKEIMVDTPVCLKFVPVGR
jgi:6-phosphogluconolactonase